MRIALTVEYDGSACHGWQKQHGLRTVQGLLEQALSKVANHPIAVVCAGRTDTGVHATHQVVHFDANVERSMRSWIYGVNSFLPKDVCVRTSKEVSMDFHARYSAISRSYRYIICNSAVRPALKHKYVTWQYRPLDHNLMQTAAQCFIGEHDFTSFRSVECQSKTPMREVMQVNIIRQADTVTIDIMANAFLHHMVRNISGVLMAVGSGRKPVTWAHEVLLAKDRRLGAETAPPYGLYLIAVNYPEKFGINL